MKNIIKLSLLFLSLILISCQSRVNKLTQDPGIVITFDDNSIAEWYSLRDLFKENGVKATFFVCKGHELTEDEVQMLRDLESDGHEIGSHSKNHLNPNDYLQTHSLDQYIDEEIISSVEDLKSLGLDVKSYSLPFGESNKDLDQRLGELFPIFRSTGYLTEDRTVESYDSFYCDTGKKYKTTRACGLDNGYGASDEDIFKGLERAKNNNEIIIFYSHRVDDKDPYGTSRDRFEKIIKKAKEEGLVFYTYSQLAG